MFDCGFSDETVHTIINSFHRLEYLDLEDNTQLTDSCLNNLDACSHLWELYLKNTNISQAAVTTFQQIHPNCDVYHHDDDDNDDD